MIDHDERAYHKIECLKLALQFYNIMNGQAYTMQHDKNTITDIAKTFSDFVLED